ncbi:MAG: hypothetical protein U0V54_11705 [Saprospiraceae bacterium]|nr:hypothetical protein [Saprospiraceae bacterium]
MTKGKYNINSWFGFLAIILLSTLFHASSNKAFANVGVSNTYHTTTHLDINFEQTRANHISTLFEVVNLNEQEVKEDLEEHANFVPGCPYQLGHEIYLIVLQKLPVFNEQSYKLFSNLPFYILFHSWKHFLF